MNLSAVDQYVTSLGPAGRQVAERQWGITLDDVGGWPLHVGLVVRGGMLRAQAEALRAGVVDGHELLFRNRSLVLVRYAHTGAGEVWVVGDLPVAAIDAAGVDRLLGLVVQAAQAIRGIAAPRGG